MAFFSGYHTYLLQFCVKGKLYGPIDLDRCITVQYVYSLNASLTLLLYSSIAVKFDMVSLAGAIFSLVNNLPERQHVMFMGSSFERNLSHLSLN